MTQKQPVFKFDDNTRLASLQTSWKSSQLALNRKEIYYLPGLKYAIITFPYDPKLLGIVRQIQGRTWDRKRKAWHIPLKSLPQAIELLEPEGFRIDDLARRVAEEAPRKSISRAEHAEQGNAKVGAAEEELVRRQVQGGVVAFVPAANAALTRRIKARGAYRELGAKSMNGYWQTAGLEVMERDLVAVLEDMEVPADAESRLFQLLYYCWRVNTGAKERRSINREYQYNKKIYLLDELCRLAAQQGSIVWGWKEDPAPPPLLKWVLYFQKGEEQVSFHAFDRGRGPDFLGEWDGQRKLTYPLPVPEPVLFPARPPKSILSLRL